MRKFICFMTMLIVLLALPSYFYPSNMGNWCVQGAFLYLMPSIDDTYFVIDAPSSSAGPIGKRRNNDFDFSPGFRIEGIYAFCDCNRAFLLNYTRLTSCTSKEIEGDFLWATVGSAFFVEQFENFAGIALSKNDLRYQSVEGLFSQRVWQCCHSDLLVFGGLEYAQIRIDEKINYQKRLGAPALGEVNQRSRAWGIGPEFGVAFDTQLCNFCLGCTPSYLSLIGRTSGSLLVSKTQIKSDNIISPFLTSTTPLDVEDEPTWRIIPAWHARLGLNYETCLLCYGVSLEVGYEFNTYIRSVNWQAFTNAQPFDSTAISEGSSLCYTAYKNFNDHGFYANLGVNF